MFDSHFLLQDGHFALSLLASLVFFAVFWLYFDAWYGRKTIKDGLKIAGFLLLSLSYLAHATTVEDTILQPAFLGVISGEMIATILQIAGFVCLLLGLIFDPLQKRPDIAHMTKSLPMQAGFAFSSLFSIYIVQGLLLPLLCGVVAALYIVRSTIGLERHLRPVGIAFALLSLSELLQLFYTQRGSENVFLYNLVASFGTIWFIEHLFQLIAVMILGIWVFRYLLKRIQSQLFMITMLTVVTIFLITTISFTVLLLANLRTDALTHLQTDSNVLKFALNSKKNETLSDAQLIAQSPDIISAMQSQDKHVLKKLASDMLVAKNEDFLVIATGSGSVMARGEDANRTGDSISSDSLVKRALEGKEASSVVVMDGVLAPSVSLRSVEPIKQNEQVIGVVMVGSSIDNAFVDGIKNATNLDASVYGGDTRSATTFVAADGTSRWIGIKEQTPAIRKTVLIDGKSYLGTVDVLNTPYYGAFVPLINVDNNPVGMLFVGEQQIVVLQTAASAIAYTFIVTVILLLFSIIPAYLISRYIVKQIR